MKKFVKIFVWYGFLLLCHSKAFAGPITDVARIILGEVIKDKIEEVRTRVIKPQFDVFGYPDEDSLFRQPDPVGLADVDEQTFNYHRKAQSDLNESRVVCVSYEEVESHLNVKHPGLLPVFNKLLFSKAIEDLTENANFNDLPLPSSSTPKGTFSFTARTFVSDGKGGHCFEAFFKGVQGPLYTNYLIFAEREAKKSGHEFRPPALVTYLPIEDMVQRVYPSGQPLQEDSEALKKEIANTLKNHPEWKEPGVEVREFGYGKQIAYLKHENGKTEICLFDVSSNLGNAFLQTYRTSLRGHVKNISRDDETMIIQGDEGTLTLPINKLATLTGNGKWDGSEPPSDTRGSVSLVVFVKSKSKIIDESRINPIGFRIDWTRN